MIEVLWHGRGGQGAFTAARLLGAAWSSRDGRHALAFPSFGPERRGAPMRAFTKLDFEPVCDHSACEQADIVVYLDGTLLAHGWERELKPGGLVLLNAPGDDCHADARVIPVDADGVSQRALGRSIPNTALLGAVTSLLVGVGLRVDEVADAIREYMAPRLHAGNIAVVEEVVAGLAARGVAWIASEDGGRCPAHGALEAPAPVEVTSAARVPVNAMRPATSPGLSSTTPPAAGSMQRRQPEVSPQAEGRVVPRLCSDSLDPAVFARSTCFVAGHLVSRNAGWRQLRPVVDTAGCTGCLQCWLQCPDGTLRRVPATTNRTGVTVEVDYDFCKGCGICARACRFGAIAMVPEREAEGR